MTIVKIIYLTALHDKFVRPYSICPYVKLRDFRVNIDLFVYLTFGYKGFSKPKRVGLNFSTLILSMEPPRSICFRAKIMLSEIYFSKSVYHFFDFLIIYIDRAERELSNDT